MTKHSEPASSEQNKTWHTVPRVNPTDFQGSYYRSAKSCKQVKGVKNYVTRAHLEQKATDFFTSDEPLSFDMLHYFGLFDLRQEPLYPTNRMFKEMVLFCSRYVDAALDESGLLTREFGIGERKLDKISTLELRFCGLLSGFLHHCLRMEHTLRREQRVKELHAWFLKCLELYGLNKEEDDQAPHFITLGDHDFEPFDFHKYADQASTAWGEVRWV